MTSAITNKSTKRKLATTSKKVSKVTKKSKKNEGKPKRPLSAYNIFFQKERERIVRKAIEKDNPGEEDVSEWLKSGRDRPHRKTHGKISFIDLAKQVGAKWKKLSVEDRSEFELQAEGEQLRYHEAMRKWKNEQDQKQIQERKIAHEEKCAAAAMHNKKDLMITNKQDTIADLITATACNNHTPNSSLIVSLPPHRTSSELNLNFHDSQEFSPETFDWANGNAPSNTAPVTSPLQQQAEDNNDNADISTEITLAEKPSPSVYNQLQALQQLKKMQQLKKTMAELSTMIQQVNTIYEQASKQMERNGYTSEAILTMQQQQERIQRRRSSVAKMSQGLFNTNSNSSINGSINGPVELGSLDNVSVIANTFENEDDPLKNLFGNRRDSLGFNF